VAIRASCHVGHSINNIALRNRNCGINGQTLSVTKAEFMWRGITSEIEPPKAASGKGVRHNFISSPGGVRGGAPAENGFWCILSLKIHLEITNVFLLTFLVQYVTASHNVRAVYEDLYDCIEQAPGVSGGGGLPPPPQPPVYATDFTR